MPSTPGITDIADPDFVNQTLLQSDCENYDDRGNAIGNIPESSTLHQEKPTAEKLNVMCAALRSTATTIQGAAAIGDGAACSLLGRSPNSSGARADITASTNGHVARRSSNAIAFGTLEAGAFATGPGIVTPSMLDNAASGTVLGRVAGGSGVRSDLTLASLGGATILHRETAALDVTSTASATAVLSYTLPAATLTAGHSLRISIRGHYSNNDNGNLRTHGYALNFGGVTLWADAGISMSGLTAFVQRTVIFELTIFALSNTLHYLTGWGQFGGSNAAATGFGDISSSNALNPWPLHGIDSTVDISSAGRLLEFTVQHSSNLATLHWVRRGAWVELL